ncbi:hypothetical protein M3Y99_00554600 [Aphelenchoides fujianensis]|nr:hypothetical protein M3Y99_00554600 [Aphelenchoides fujianensis]
MFFPRSPSFRECRGADAECRRAARGLQVALRQNGSHPSTPHRSTGPPFVPQSVGRGVGGDDGRPARRPAAPLPTELRAERRLEQPSSADRRSAAPSDELAAERDAAQRLQAVRPDAPAPAQIGGPSATPVATRGRRESVGRLFSPHYEHVNFEQPNAKVEVEEKAASTKPQPPPRPSLSKKTPPVAPPRRRVTTTLDGRLPTAMTQSMYVEKEAPVLVRSQATSTTNLARSTPDLTLDLDLSLVATPSAAQATISIDDSNATTSDSPSASTPPRPPNKPPMLRDRPVGHQKPPRPTLSTRRSGGSFPSPDSSRDSGVVDDSLPTPDLMAADPDFEERVRRWERQAER